MEFLTSARLLRMIWKVMVMGVVMVVMVVVVIVVCGCGSGGDNVNDAASVLECFCL